MLANGSPCSARAISARFGLRYPSDMTDKDLAACFRHSQRIRAEILGGADIRLCAMLGVGFLERYLPILIAGRHPRMTNARADSLFGALRSFSARVDLAESTGSVEPRVGAQWRLLSQIRNRFSHQIDAIDTTDPKIRAWLDPMPLNQDLKHFGADRRLRYVIVASMYALYGGLAGLDAVQLRDLFEKPMEEWPGASN